MKTKVVPVCRLHDFLHRRTKRLNKETTGTHKRLGKVAGYKINENNLMTLGYTNNSMVGSGKES